MNRVTASSRLAVASAGLVLALTACSGSDAAPGATSGSATTGPGAAPASSAKGSATKNGSQAPPVSTDKPSVAISSAPAVKVGKTAKFSDDVTVKVSRVRSVKVKANGPGDLAGAGVSVGLTVQNASKEPFDLNGLAVTATYGSTDKPAVPGGVENGDPLAGKLKAGKSAKGEYVFNVPTAQADSLQVQVASNSSPIILVFDR